MRRPQTHQPAKGPTAGAPFWADCDLNADEQVVVVLPNLVWCQSTAERISARGPHRRGERGDLPFSA